MLFSHILTRVKTRSLTPTLSPAVSSCITQVLTRCDLQEGSPFNNLNLAKSSYKFESKKVFF